MPTYTHILNRAQQKELTEDKERLKAVKQEFKEKQKVLEESSRALLAAEVDRDQALKTHQSGSLSKKDLQTALDNYEWASEKFSEAERKYKICENTYYTYNPTFIEKHEDTGISIGIGLLGGLSLILLADQTKKRVIDPMIHGKSEKKAASNAALELDEILADEQKENAVRAKF